MSMRSMRARLSLPIFCSVSDSDIGKTLPFAHTTTASVMPAASSASKTAGRMRDCGVGRNWLSITIATLRAPASSSLKRGPECGCSSACAAAAVAFGHRLGLVGPDLGQQVRLGDVELERVAVDELVVLGRADRERVDRLVRNHSAMHLRHPWGSSSLD